MDKDFHFGTIYVLSRWAGFDSCNSLTIASASQFVDDNTSNIGSSKRVSGHALWRNIFSTKGNNEVWIPFHFLPGLTGDAPDEKLICKKNSRLAQSLIHELPEINANDTISLFRLGIALHVYADTWAHQGFSGQNSPMNKIETLQIISSNESSKNLPENKKVKMSPIDLGHVHANHWPDRPYIQWQCAPQFTNGRKNWDEFMEASHEIYKLLTKIILGIGTDLTAKQENLLLDTFQSIQDRDIDSRTDGWLTRIHDNVFHFKDFPGHNHAAVGDDTKATYKQGFITNDDTASDQFYTALDAHYNWVRKKLNAVDVHVLA